MLDINQRTIVIGDLVIVKRYRSCSYEKVFVTGFTEQKATVNSIDYNGNQLYRCVSNIMVISHFNEEIQNLLLNALNKLY